LLGGKVEVGIFPGKLNLYGTVTIIIQLLMGAYHNLSDDVIQMIAEIYYKHTGGRKIRMQLYIIKVRIETNQK
jgi:hypothetical protein